MINFIFIAPESSKININFCNRLKQNGINVLGISSTPYDYLNDELKNSLTEYYKVEDFDDYDSFIKAVGYFTYKYGKIDWVESNNEKHLILDSKIRKDFNIQTGINSDTIMKYKNRFGLKEFYRKARIPSPRYASVSSIDKAKVFVERVGYPLIIKPSICGKNDNIYVINNEKELTSFYKNKPSDASYIMEELISGEIYTYDGICDSSGEVIVEASHITPSVIDTINKKDICYYTNIKVSNRLSSIGKKVIKCFNLKSRFFHLEFFKLSQTKRGLGKAGRYVIVESSLCPEDIYFPDMINYANSFDIYQLWADMIAYDAIRHSYNGAKYYCVSASRRDGSSYMHTHEDIIKHYGNSLVISERIPDNFSSIMGNQIYAAKVNSLKQLETFKEYVLDKK